jgi:hypothetical protein
MRRDGDTRGGSHKSHHPLAPRTRSSYLASPGFPETTGALSNLMRFPIHGTKVTPTPRLGDVCAFQGIRVPMKVGYESRGAADDDRWRSSP